jgi:NarL family two-component system response regulator LiaR
MRTADSTIASPRRHAYNSAGTNAFRRQIMSQGAWVGGNGIALSRGPTVEAVDGVGEKTVTIKVLLAEDHVITRQGIRRVLEEESDIEVVGEAGDGVEAVKLAVEAGADVVIMDIAMPRMNGIEATKRIKETRPMTAVLILSAYDDDEYVFGLLEAGAAGYLLKTVGGDEIVRAVRAVFNGEPVLDPVIAKKVIARLTSHGKAREITREAVLSDREMEVLKLAAKGMGNKDIGSALHLSRRTVEGTLRAVFNKLGVASRVEAILFGLRRGWFKLEELP